jgi:hypothetical protein
MGKRSCHDPPLPEWPETITGGKYVRMLEKHVRALRDSTAHGNRQLFLDDVVVAQLLAFFNPTLRSLRTIEDFSQTRQAQRHLSVRRLCKSTLSDFHRVADPALLEPLITQLKSLIAGQCGATTPLNLPQTLGKVLAIDGSYFSVAADVAWAVKHATNRGNQKASVRLDLHLNIANWLPEVVQVSGQGTSEAQAAAQAVQPGAIHSLAGSTHRDPPDVLLREVVIDSPGEPDGQVRLLTNLMDLEAHLLGLLYRCRWQIELFFRWLKCFANFAHLISESRQGVLLSFYVAVIGVLLMYAHSGHKPSKYAYNLLSLVASGAATLDEIAPILAERERRAALDRASLARRKNRKS